MPLHISWVDYVSRAFRSIRLFFGVLKYVRFSLLLAAVLVAAVFSDQGRDALIALGDAPLAPGIALLTTSFLAGLMVWYSARVMYRFRFHDLASHPAVYPGLKKWLPRVLAPAVPLIPALGLWAVLADAGDNAQRMRWLGVALVVVAGVLAAITIKRRAIFRLQSFQTEAGRYARLNEWRRDSPWGVRVMLAVFATSLIFFALFIKRPGAGVAFGPVALVLLAGFFFIVSGSLLTYLGDRYRVPALTLVVIWLIAISPFTDNHRVRLARDMKSTHTPTAAERAQWQKTGSPLAVQSLRAYFQLWASGLPKQPGLPIPVIFISAEGGGIRAAYWTASVLAELQDRSPQFARHIFAISGVSGGSLGAVIFAAGLRDDRPQRCAMQHTPGFGPLRSQVSAILSRDMLSPTLANMLFPDMTQRFLPYPFLPDRAVALEDAWANAYAQCSINNILKKPYQSLWYAQDYRVPLLFLNSTAVENGKRLIMHPLASAGFDQTFHYAIDGAETLGRTVPLNTAAHLSARFTYVSPAGTVDSPGVNGQPLKWSRLVDGGYFENSGTVTLTELLAATEKAAKNLGIPIRPIVLHIANEPLRAPKAVKTVDTSLISSAHVMLPNASRGAQDSTISRVQIEARRPFSIGAWLGQLAPEVLSPFKALFNVRPARGFQALGALHERYRDSAATFSLCEYDVGLPLGWMLSEASRMSMDGQLPHSDDAANGAAHHNNAIAGWLERILNGSTEDAPNFQLVSGRNCVVIP